MKFVCGLLLLCLVLSGAASSREVPADILPPGIAPQHQAPIALLVDLSSGQTLYDRNAGQRFLPASMTKAMTALVAFDLIAAGKLNEDTVLLIVKAFEA